MMISTRGRYALRVMIDLAQQGTNRYTPLKEVAERQRISKKYIEAIMGSLSKAGLVDAVHGKGGGYRLIKPAEEYSVGEILRVTEGDLAPVACLEQGAAPCAYAADCKTLPVWDKLNLLINDYLDGVTLDSLA
ncbi:MAG: RrF2 family transcriptional regulator [Firmicutes bacterium]|nr:RrF2 family transcriptional regulator [Bacillota bacterium]